jgi:hypothetical protein
MGTDIGNDSDKYNANDKHNYKNQYHDKATDDNRENKQVPLDLSLENMIDERALPTVASKWKQVFESQKQTQHSLGRLGRRAYRQDKETSPTDRQTCGNKEA